MAIERIELLGIPLDIASEADLEELVNKCLKEDSSGKNIVLLSLGDLLRARRDGIFRDYVLGARLVIPISKSLVHGARFLTGKIPVRYMPFDFVIKLLSILEKYEKTVYLLGAHPSVLRRAEQNIRATFPRMRIVGRFPAGIRKQEEDTVLLSIRKCAPSLLMVGRGVRGREKWLAKNTDKLPQNFRLWVSDIFEIFAETKKRCSDFAFEHGLEWIGLCLRSPLRIFRVFSFFYYGIILIIEKIKNKNGDKK